MADKTLVIDNGTGTIYAGLAEEEDPISVFYNLIGDTKAPSPRRNVNFIDFSDAKKYSGFVNSVKNGDLKISYPMEHGAIVDWDGMELIWDYTFDTALGVKPEECNLLITEAVMNSKPNREKMAHILFEKFNFPALYVSHSAILPLYSAGLTTGIVLDCGEGVVQTVPVWGGYPINESMNRADFGGKDSTELFGRLIREKGYGNKPLEVLRWLKEQTSLVSLNAAEDAKVPDTAFQLPDGEIVKLGQERYQCAELLFRPSLMEDTDIGGVHEMLYKSIMKTNMDIRRDLYGSIVLSGGATLAPGFAERISKELAALLPAKAKLTIRAPPERRYATWKGASVVASLSSFNRLLISKQEYDDVGPSIMHKNK